ncbi:sterol 14-demethylase [Rhizophagus irregularis DAOM 197198w]|uniref:Sterol 14-demethylase n=3 Tax=Rhizophagus irregularis TaxID=588596 RepID=A0A015JU60_RHIIW|nr:sterol 14-demethylase [Rhizophagus irregularis DAOM 197198w]
MTYVTYYYYKYFTRVNPLPCLFPFPLIDIFPYVYLWFNGDIISFVDYCYEKYGDIYEVYGSVRSIILCRGEYLDDFSSNNTHEMKFRNCQGAEELGLQGKGLSLNNDYKSWMFNHHFFNQAILSPRFTTEAIDQTNKLFNELEIYWSKLFLKEEIIKENKNKLDFSEWFCHYTNDIIFKLLTGKRSYSMAAYFDTLNDEKYEGQSARFKDSVKLTQGLRKLFVEYTIFFVIPPFIRHYVPFFKNKADEVLKSMEFINQRLNAIIKSRREEIEKTPLDEPLPHDMLTSMIIKNTLRDDNYIQTGVEAMRTMSDTEIRINILDGIHTGTYKTANMFSLIVYYIAHNPDVKRKMLNEIENIFQGDKMRPITKDDFYNLRYCEAIVKEVARIHPVVSLLTRYIDKPNKIAKYHWPADTMFLINIKAIHNNDDDWEEPNKFNPDRWMDENFEPKKNSFFMFGGGSRLCPGRKLATIELVCLMALLFRKYEIDLADMNTPIKTSGSLMILSVDLLVEIRLKN